MNKLLLATAVMAALLPAAGCGCGAFNGAGDRVYERGTESLMLCENGGFVANLSSGTIEGKYTEPTTASATGLRGDNGELAFDLTLNGDGTASTTQLGDQPWQQIDLDQTALDHADVQCSDLLTRPWWNAQ